MIWVLAEQEGGGVAEASLECLADARELAAKQGREVWGVVLGSDLPDSLAIQLARHGADRTLLIEHDLLEPYTTDAWMEALAPLCGQYRPSFILQAHSLIGRDLAPRLAARLGCACATDALALGWGPDETLEVTRPAYADKVYQTVCLGGPPPRVVTLRPGVAGVGKADPARRPEIERVRPELDPSRCRTRVIKTIPADPRTIDIREAERIVAVGRGAGGPEGVALVQELADCLEAAVGGSRVAVDLGWLPWERQVGQSGRTVTPRLYIACGISGASQHLAGMRSAETILAINKEKTAPIFGVAHLGVLGDLRQIIPALIQRLRGRKS